MHPDHAPSNLALVQEFPKPYLHIKPCDFRTAPVLPHLHNDSATASLAACVEVEISVHG